MDGTILVERDPAVEVTSGAEEVHSLLIEVTLVAVTHFGLCEDQDLGVEQVPLCLCAIGFEEGFLACRGATEGEEVVDL